MIHRPIIGFGYFRDELRERRLRQRKKRSLGAFSPEINDMRWEETGDGFEYVHIHSTEILSCANMLVSAATYIELGNDPEPQPAVIVDWVFDRLSADTQEFFLQHEIGHLKCGHLMQRDDSEKTKRSFSEELEADEYAASVIGAQQAVTALQQSGIYLRRLAFVRWDPTEFQLRIRVLQGCA